MTAHGPDAERTVVALSTAPSREVAERVASTVVEERLAACANIVPGITSIYRWQGEVQKDVETLIVFKTTERVLAALERRIVELHPYDVPELVSLPVGGGHEPYLAWVRAETE